MTVTLTQQTKPATNPLMCPIHLLPTIIPPHLQYASYDTYPRHNTHHNTHHNATCDIDSLPKTHRTQLVLSPPLLLMSHLSRQTSCILVDLDSESTKIQFQMGVSPCHPKHYTIVAAYACHLHNEGSRSATTE